MARTPDGRGPLAIGLLISLAAHLAALAWVRLDVPSMETARLDVIAVRPADPVEPEPPLLVVRIQPPGMSVPSAAAAPGPRSVPVSTPAATRQPASLDAPVRLTASTPSRVSLAPAAPIAPAPEIVLASTADETAGVGDASTLPARGVVLRQGDGAAGGNGTSGTAPEGRGRSPFSGGVTSIGPGGDCITPGLIAPGGRSLPVVGRARTGGAGPGSTIGRRGGLGGSGNRNP